MAVSKSLTMFLIFACSQADCAFTVKDRVYQNMALAGSAGVLYGFSQPENRNTYGLLYGSLGAALAAAITLYIFDPDRETTALTDENKRLKASLDQFQSRSEPKLFQQGHSLFNSPIPKDVSTLVDPGEWKRYKMDQWVQDPNQSNIWYRQVEMFEIIPPVSR